MEPKLALFFQWLNTEHADQIDDPGFLEEIFMDDADFALDLLQTAFESIHQYQKETEQPFANNERPFYIAVHSLKSTARSLGMNKTGDYYEKVEKELIEGNGLTSDDIDLLKKRNNELQLLVQQMIGFLKR